MSNFDFLNNKDFLKHPSCVVLYEYACSAEAAYSDHEKCALKVRFILEQFCIFVSELKNASYPEKISMLGQYWGKKNWMEFIKIFGYENARHIKHANAISRSFLHSIKSAREDIYPEMLESVYILLLWLYKELGFHTQLKYNDYSIKKISLDTLYFESSSQEIYYSSEELKQNLKTLFPNCNTNQLCSVIRQADRYIITDVFGNQIEEFIEAEKYENSEKERIQLKKQLEQTGKQFESAKEEFLEKQSRQETFILELTTKITDIEQQNKVLDQKQYQEVLKLQNQVQKLEKERTHMAEMYKKSLQELGNRYDMLQEKYEELIPIKEKKLQMQQQIKDFIQERKDQKKIFSDTRKKLLKEIDATKKRLEFAQQNLLSMGTSAQESQKLIHHLRNQLSEKEKEILDAQNLAKIQLEKMQTETKETIQKYKDKANSFEIILTDVMAENARFREKLSDFSYVEDIKGYLQLINQSVSQIEEGYTLYQQDKNEQKLRKYLWEIKTYYDSKIKSLEKALKEKDEKLAQEQQKNSTLFENLWEEKIRTQTYENLLNSEQKTIEGDFLSKKSTQKNYSSKKKKYYKWSVALVVSLLIFITLALFLNDNRIFSGKNLEDDQANNIIQPSLVENKVQASNMPQEVKENKVNKANVIPKETELQENAEIQKENEFYLEEESQNGENLPESSGTLSGNDNETEERLADKILKEAQKERERICALPNTVAEIPNISQDILDDMETMRGIFKDFYKVASPRYGDETEEYQRLGTYRMFGIVRTIYQISSLKISKFVYCTQSKTGFRLAVEPNAISTNISYHTSLAELENILGESYIPKDFPAPGFKPTDFSEDLTDEKYKMAVFDFGTDEDSQESSSSIPNQNIVFIYNEDMTEMLDYAYVYEHKGW